MNRSKKETRQAVKLPSAAHAAVCVFPAVLTVLFYALRSNKSAIDWTSAHVSAPIRGVLSFFSSVYPFSLMEVMCVAAGIWLIYYIVKTIVVTIRRREKLKILSKRLLTIAAVVLYVWGLFCWLWNSGYHASSFAEKNDLVNNGVTVSDLYAVTSLFAEKANELSLLVKRDDDGRYIEDRLEIFDISTLIYSNIAIEYPSLDGRLYKPKPMMFSWLMSRTGYTGIYFALTGESNINTRAPVFLMPATIAHELAHQLGVAAEDEANFAGILACVTSGYTAYEYAGYLLGLMYLRNALFQADFQKWADIGISLSAEVNRDLQDNYEYWQSQKTVETGVEFFDNVLTTLTETVSDAVTNVYDGYLKSQNQELGVRSYGACVDLLVGYFSVSAEL